MRNERERQINNDPLVQLEQGKKYSKFQWFLFVILIPLLFAIAITFVVLSIAGINVIDLAQKYGEKVPVINTLLTDEEKTNANNEEEVSTLKTTIKDQEQEISKLKAEIDRKQNDLDLSKEEIGNLTAELEALKGLEREATMKLEELAKVYETMSAKKSAAIFSEMNNKDVLEILVKMNNESRASVMEKLDPGKAAELTVLLKAEEDKKNIEINSEHEAASVENVAKAITQN